MLIDFDEIRDIMHLEKPGLEKQFGTTSTTNGEEVGGPKKEVIMSA